MKTNQTVRWLLSACVPIRYCPEAPAASTVYVNSWFSRSQFSAFWSNGLASSVFIFAPILSLFFFYCLKYVVTDFLISTCEKSYASSKPIRYGKIHLFAGRAVKRERRKGSSRRQQPAYGAAVNEVARELLHNARSPKRENGGRRYIKHDGMIASPVDSCLCCWQLPLSPPVPPLFCSAPHCPPLSLSDQVWCIQRCDCVNCT